MTLLPPGIRRFALLLHYDGAPFHGWQMQESMVTVQGEVEAVLERITEARRVVVGSGRTDRGVHALGQVASVDVPEKWTAHTLRKALNALLPGGIWVEAARAVPSDFHPRFQARLRTYRYQVGLHPWAASPLHRGRCWRPEVLRAGPVDRELLHAAARLLPGERSFRSFAKAGQPQRGYRCRVSAASWDPWRGDAAALPLEEDAGVEGELGLRFHITSNRYLHHMVRYLVGTMVEVAVGRRKLQDFHDLLEDPEGELTTSPPAPPQGLFLLRVEYPPEAWGKHPDRADRDPPGSWPV